MARRTVLTSLPRISEINLTPLMDLTFILLITFIITFPLIEQGIPVELPRASAESLSPDTARTITIDAQGALFWDDAPVELSELEQAIRAVTAAEDTPTVMIRADERVRYAEVVKVLKMLHATGVTRMALVTQEDSP